MLAWEAIEHLSYRLEDMFFTDVDVETLDAIAKFAQQGNTYYPDLAANIVSIWEEMKTKAKSVSTSDRVAFDRSDVTARIEDFRKMANRQL